MFAWGENSEEWDIGRLTQVDSEEVGLDTVEVEEGSRGEEEVGTDWVSEPESRTGVWEFWGIGEVGTDWMSEPESRTWV